MSPSSRLGGAVSQAPSPGDVVLVTRKASVQFVQPMAFRVIRVLTEHITYHGWLWLRGYQLDDKGHAIANREIFVQPAGLVTLRKRQAQQPTTISAQRKKNMSPLGRVVSGSGGAVDCQQLMADEGHAVGDEMGRVARPDGLVQLLRLARVDWCSRR